MPKVSEVTVDLQMWSTVVLTPEEVLEIVPEWDGEDTDSIQAAIEEHMDFNYLDLIQYADGALDEVTINFDFEEDTTEEDI